MRRVEDELRRSVVLLELDDGRVRPVALEVEDVADVRAAPAVDRLVVVADDRQVPVLRREGLDPQVLRAVRVLVFVDMEIAPAILVTGECLRRFLEQPNRIEEQIVEVERVGLLEGRPVQAGKSRDLDGDPRREAERRDLRRVEHVVLRAADGPEDRRRSRLALRLEAFLAQHLLHQLLLVLRVVDDEPAVEPEGLAVAPQHARADRVERPGLDLAAGLADEPDDPFPQLSRGAIREGDREDLPRCHPLDPDEVRDPMRQHARLARACSRENQHGTLGRSDRAALLRIQPPEDLALARVGDLGLVFLLRGLRLRVCARLRISLVGGRLGQPVRLRRKRQAASPGAAGLGGASSSKRGPSPSKAASSTRSRPRRRGVGVTRGL